MAEKDKTEVTEMREMAEMAEEKVEKKEKREQMDIAKRLPRKRASEYSTTYSLSLG